MGEEGEETADFDDLAMWGGVSEGGKGKREREDGQDNVGGPETTRPHSDGTDPTRFDLENAFSSEVICVAPSSSARLSP